VKRHEFLGKNPRGKRQLVSKGKLSPNTKKKEKIREGDQR